jgi:hypothetical protein
MTSINSLFLCGLGKNYVISGRSWLFCQFTRKAITLGLEMGSNDVIRVRIGIPPYPAWGRQLQVNFIQ